MWAWLAGGLGVVLAIGLVALAVQRARATAAAGQPAAAGGGQAQPAIQVSGPLRASIGHPSPTVTVPTLAGGAFRLPADRPAVVHFMAAWCESCQAEAQALGQLQERSATAWRSWPWTHAGESARWCVAARARPAGITCGGNRFPS